MYRKLKATLTLPKIIYFIGLNDYGPCDRGHGSATCPHCGAEGRYVYAFICEDGTTRGAMKGCVQLFPKHLLATESLRILQKEAEYRAKKPTPWSLPSWDLKIKEAIERFAKGEIQQWEAEAIVKSEKFRAQQYRKNRHRF